METSPELSPGRWLPEGKDEENQSLESSPVSSDQCDPMCQDSCAQMSASNKGCIGCVSSWEGSKFPIVLISLVIC